MILHAGLIARRVAGDWRGVLIEGSSGSGKSDLALRAVAAGWRLVADDRVLLWRSGERLYGRAPAPLAGLIEVREAGLLSLIPRPFAPVSLAVTHAEEAERPVEDARRSLLSASVPLLSMNLRAASAPERLALALQGKAAQ